MKNILFILILLMFLIGCGAHGPIKDKYPPVYTSPIPSTIVIERPNIFKGSGMNFMVSVNGEAVYGIKNGEQLVFNVEPGENFFGAMGVNPWTHAPAHHEIMINCEPGKTYYMLVQIHLNIAPTIERVSKLEIREK